MSGTLVSIGKPFDMHNCIICAVVDGQITRLDEYIDPSLSAALFG